MIFRKKLRFSTTQILFYFRKELVLLALITISLGSGVIDSSIHPEKLVWQDSQKSVKGQKDLSSLADHIREIEIIPVKYEPPPKIREGAGKKEIGVARKIDEYTYTMDVEQDAAMAGVSEIVTALNTYRQAKGRGALTVDQKLSDYAQMRAGFFTSKGGMDSHAGFSDFISNQDGFNKMGFFSLGENSSFGYQLSGTHLIEWVFAGDAPHENNQLNPEWTHVGVGVSGQAVDIIFGGRKQ